MDDQPEKESSLSPEERNIRKIRKKLRQIERLELSDRDLNEEELVKVKSKVSLRRELRSLLTDIHPDEADLMKRQGFSIDNAVVNKKAKNTVKSESESQSEVQPGPQSEAVSSTTIKSEPVEKRRESSSIPSTSCKSTGGIPSEHVEAPTRSTTKETATSVSVKSSKGLETHVTTKVEQVLWRDSVYQVFTLEGHNDIILSVDCTDDYVISASRDTTVKVWRIGKTEEERSLRGHTTSVTAVSFLPAKLASAVLKKFEDDPEALPSPHSQKSADCRVLAVSGSLDCTLRVWDVQSGESFGSIYTYNGITVMKCSSWGAVTGTEGGKLEVWCIVTGQRLAFINAFQCQVTALYIDGYQIYAGSAEGDAGLWRFDPSTRSLSAEFIMECESQSYVPLRRLSAIVGERGIFYFGDSGPNIKVLDWKKGTATRHVNHISDIGMTDSLVVSPDGHLLSSSYFVDTGCSSINVREMATGKYVCSLVDKDEGRYLAMSAAPGIVVTGGHLLKVWIQGEKKNAPKKNKASNSEVIHPNVFRKLSARAVESASEDDTDCVSSDDEDVGPHTDMSEVPCDGEEGRSGWWCNIL